MLLWAKWVGDLGVNVWRDGSGRGLDGGAVGVRRT